MTVLNWKETLVPISATIRGTLQTIDNASTQIVLVVGINNRLLGTVTDGDIRRGILKGYSLDEPVEKVMNSQPVVAKQNQTRESMIELMQNGHARRLPVLDEDGCVIGIENLDDLIQPKKCDNWVVLMAGGMGQRLRPLTEDIPKPLLKVGDKPIMEIILTNLIKYGFHKFYISVNYKAEMVKEYFGDGSRWDVEIQYLHENKHLGTAGSLGLLPEKPTSYTIVMNSDLLTKINFHHLLSFHHEHKAHATMCIRKYDLKVPFGVVEVESNKITNINEKPLKEFFVNAGIYVLEPEALSYIPENTYFDMNNLFDSLISNNKETVAFPIREYWLDIGHINDYKTARWEFNKFFQDK